MFGGVSDPDGAWTSPEFPHPSAEQSNTDKQIALFIVSNRYYCYVSGGCADVDPCSVRVMVAQLMACAETRSQF